MKVVSKNLEITYNMNFVQMVKYQLDRRFETDFFSETIDANLSKDILSYVEKLW